MFGLAGAIGIPPSEFLGMSVWQFFAYVDGWIKANSPSEGLTKEEQDDIWAWLQDKPDTVNSFSKVG